MNEGRIRVCDFYLKEDTMQTQAESRIRIDYILAQAFAYLFAGIFLLTIQNVEMPSLLLQIIGYIFLGAAFLLVVAPFCNRFMRWANKLHKILSGGLLFATLALLVSVLVETAGSKFLFLVIVVWFFLLVASLLFSWYRQMRYASQEVGAKVVSIRGLRGLAIILSMLAALLLLLKVTVIGNPVLYLAAGLFAVSLASLLEYH